MEEDIKILEEMRKKMNKTLSHKITRQEFQAIENLIKGYRELEEKLNQLLKYEDDLRIKERAFCKENHIPKSKIKEKIEELETKLKVFEKDIRYCKDKVEARLMNDEIYVLRRCMDLLKELMEDK